MHTQSTPNKRKKLSNLIIRFITGMLVLVLVVFVVLWGGWMATVPLIAIASLAIAELHTMASQRNGYNDRWLAIGATIGIIGGVHQQMPLWWLSATVIALAGAFVRGGGSWRRLGFMMLSLLYIAFPFACLPIIRQIDPFGIHWTFAILYNTWSNDTFAYFGGKLVGKRPLYPHLSPNKTIEGAIVGIVCGAVLSMAVLDRIDELTIVSGMMLVLATVTCTAGDFFESGLKRYFSVKDSRLPGVNVLPGHGGVLDRVDGLIGVIIVVFIYLFLNGYV